MYKLKQFIEKYWSMMVGLMALAATVAFNWVHLATWRYVTVLGRPYLHYTFIGGDAMTNLAPMFRDIIDGNWFPSDGRIFEYRGLPNLWSLVDVWLASPILLLTKSVPITMLVGKLLAVFIATLIVYLLLKALIKQSRLAAVFSLIFFPAALFWNFLTPAAVNASPLIFNFKIIVRTIFHLGSPPGEILLSKYESLSSFPGLVVFAVALYLLHRALEKNRLIDALWAGALIGFNAYTYATDFLYLGSVLGVLFIIFAIRREWQRVRLISIMIITMLISALPYFATVLGVNQMPYGDELYRRLGGEITHAIRWSFWPRYLVYLGFATLVWWTAKKQNREMAGLFVGALIATAIVVFNIQVVTGFNPSPPVWWLHQLYFAFGLGWAMLAAALVQSFKKPLFRQATEVVIILAIVSIFVRVVTTNQFISNYTYPATLLPRNLEKSFNWLNANTAVDSVVGTPSLVLNTLIPVLTHNNVYLPVAVVSPVSLADITDRFLTIYKLYKVSPEYFFARLERQPIEQDEFTYEKSNALTTFMFDAYYYSTALNQSLDNRYSPVPRDVLQKLMIDYKKYPQRSVYLLNHNRLDYLYISKYERIMMHENFDKISGLNKVYDEDGVIIYKVNK